MRRIAILLKTSEGGLWSIPHAVELRSRGCDVVFVVPRGGGSLVESARSNGFEVNETEFQYRFNQPRAVFAGFIELRKLFRELRPDILFYHLYASALAGRLASLGLGIRRVHMVAGPVYLESRAIRAAESILVGLDSVLIAGSEFTFQKYFNVPLGLARSRMRTIAYGVDTSTRVPASDSLRAAARDKLGIENSIFVVVMVAYFYAPKALVGHSTGLKGHEDLLEAWTCFHKNHPATRLLIVGGGFGLEGERYRTDLIESSYSEGVEWIGSVKDVAPFYHAADISVSPSLSENHGAAMEASAYGLPSIVSSAGGLPEMVTNTSGWVFQSGSKDELLGVLEEAYSVHEDRGLHGMGLSARSFVEANYSHKIVVPKVADAVLSGIARRSRLGIVTEARFNRSLLGEWVATDRVNGDGQWRNYWGLGRQVMVLGRGFSGLVVSSEDSSALVETELFPLPAYAGIGGFLRSLPCVMWSLFKGIKSCDVLLLRVPGPLSVLSGILAKLLRLRYAVEVVGDIQGVLDRGASRTIVRPIASAMTRFVVSGASAVRYVTEESLQAKYPARTPRAIAFSDVQISDSDVVVDSRSNLSNPDRIVLLAVGSQNNDYKGHQYAIAALPQLLERFGNVELRLVGEGMFQQSLRNTAKAHGVADNVIFLGQMSRESVIAEMDSADLLLQPSRTEGLPRTIVEGMSRALPSVGSRIGGIPELLPDSLLFDVGDVNGLAECVARCVDTRDGYSRYSSIALSRADDFRQSVLSSRSQTWLDWLSSL